MKREATPADRSADESVKTIPYGRHMIDDGDVAAVLDALTSDFLTQGPRVGDFEASVAAATGARHAVAVNSATSALHIACLALGVGPGDRVWTSPISFVASANCARLCGADIDFVDIDADSLNMSPDALAEKLSAADAAGCLPKVLIPVHMCGRPAEMDAISHLARRYGVRIVEDASHAIGARFHERPIGACEHSDVTVFSFHPVKIVTTAEGGIATTNDDALAAKMRLSASHGVTRDPTLMHDAPEGPWCYDQISLGLNYRMSELHAALGSSQMRRLDDFVRARNRLAARYDEALRDLPLDLPPPVDRGLSSVHLYVIRLRQDELRSGRREIFERLRQRGIGVNVHYIPIYRQPYYRAMGFAAGHCPQAERYYERAISIPIFAQMTPDEQDRVIEALRDTLGEAKR